jgi:ComF family protein
VNEAWYGLCEDCREAADAALADFGLGGEGESCRCNRCGKPLISEQDTCLACREKGESALDRALTLFPYAGKFRLLLRAYKFGKNRAAGHYFTEKIEEALAQLTGELGPPAVSTGEPAEELTHPSLLNILRNILFVKKKNAKVKKNAEKNTHGSLESALEWIFSADPVVILSGSEFAKSETDLVTQVAEYFKGIGGMVEREGLGIVDLTRRGVKSSIAHGIGRKKAAAFKAVPEVIKKGKIIDFQLNWKGRGYNTCIIDAPVTIGTTPYIAEVIINQDKDGQRFYVHEVELKEKAQSAFKTGMDTSALRASHLIITRKLADVKKKNAEKTLPFAIVPVPPRPGKIKKAGWDQVEYLACLLERGRGVPVRRCLKRLASKVQKELNREERMRNLRGRMVLKGKPPAVAVILDDVVTTGSTLEACAEVLKEGGTEKVYGISLFYN